MALCCGDDGQSRRDHECSRTNDPANSARRRNFGQTTATALQRAHKESAKNAVSSERKSVPRDPPFLIPPASSLSRGLSPPRPVTRSASSPGSHRVRRRRDGPVAVRHRPFFCVHPCAHAEPFVQKQAIHDNAGTANFSRKDHVAQAKEIDRKSTRLNSSHT